MMTAASSRYYYMYHMITEKEEEEVGEVVAVEFERQCSQLFQFHFQREYDEIGFGKPPIFQENGHSQTLVR